MNVDAAIAGARLNPINANAEPKPAVMVFLLNVFTLTLIFSRFKRRGFLYPFNTCYLMSSPIILMLKDFYVNLNGGHLSTTRALLQMVIADRQLGG